MVALSFIGMVFRCGDGYVMEATAAAAAVAAVAAAGGGSGAKIAKRNLERTFDRTNHH